MNLIAASLFISALCIVPSASALDWFPDHVRVEAKEARLLVRLPQGGTLHIDASQPVQIAIVEPGTAPPGFTSTPASHHVGLRGPDASWHGLDGTVEIVVRRADAGTPVDITVRSEGDAGVQWTWPPARETPALGAAGIVATLGVLTIARRRSA